jgi:hypothetical protein
MQQRDARERFGSYSIAATLAGIPLVALEIDLAVGLLVPAADEARNHAARIVAAAGLLALDQRLFRRLLW